MAAFERRTRELLNEPELLAVVDRFGADDVVWPDGLPPELQEGRLPLLTFPPRRGNAWSRVRAWPPSLVLSFNAETLWGPHGGREILLENELGLLEAERDSFLDQIWNDPWNFRS